MKKAIVTCVACATGLVLSTVVAAGASFGAAAKRGAAECVAEGFPAWEGVTEKNHLCGRKLASASDLRQRVTVVIEIDANNAREQLEKTGSLGWRNFSPSQMEGKSWELYQMPRESIVLYVVRNLKDREAFLQAKKPKDQTSTPGLCRLWSFNSPIYEGITFKGAPDNGGKFPFVYVMGCEGTTPLTQGPLSKDTGTLISKAISEHMQARTEKGLKWRPFFGYAEPQGQAELERLIRSGKPIVAFQEKIRKQIASRDEKTAREAQMLYDALAQTCDDSVYMALCAADKSPHVAAYWMDFAVRHWPNTRRQLEGVAEKVKANAEAKPMVAMYPKLVRWSDPDFACKNAGEAKKIVGELAKMKKTLEKLKESKDVSVQNGAVMLDGIVDELTSTIPARTASS